MAPAPGGSPLGPEPSNRRFSRFDRAVVGVLGVLAGVIAVIVWRGDRVGATVESVTPADGATGASRTSAIRAELSGEPVPGGAAPLSVEPTVAGAVAWEGRAVVLRPAAPLAPDTTYRVTLRAGLATAQGRVLGEPFTWTFTTGATRVAYLFRDAADLGQLATVPPAGGEPGVLTGEDEHGIWEYAVSPDGATLVYSVMRPGGGSDVVAVARDGSARRVVLSSTEAECTGLAWAPDGATLIYERRALPPQPGPPSPPRLWWLDVATGETVPVFADNQRLGFGARIAPDGRRLAYVSPADGAVHVYDLETEVETVIESQSGEPAEWSPDGSALLVSDVRPSGEDFVSHVFAARFGADGAAEMTNLSGDDARVEDGAPAWSPDGRWIVFTRREVDGPGATMGKQIWRMGADGSAPERLTLDGTQHYSSPRFSPDGAMLLFQRVSLASPGAEPVVGVLDLTGNVERELVAPAMQPAWLP